MIYKVIFGIAIPLVVILAVGIIGSLDIGFSEQVEFFNKLTFNDMIEVDQFKNQIYVGSITYSNEYFLGKRIQLPKYLLCLVDSESVSPRVDIGQVQYSESQSNTLGQSYGYYDDSRSIELAPGQTKKIYLYVQPTLYVDRTTDPITQNLKPLTETLIERYGSYDAIAAVELSDGSASNRYSYNYYPYYYSCAMFSQSEIDAAPKISLR